MTTTTTTTTTLASLPMIDTRDIPHYLTISRRLREINAGMSPLFGVTFNEDNPVILGGPLWVDVENLNGQCTVQVWELDCGVLGENLISVKGGNITAIHALKKIMGLVPAKNFISGVGDNDRHSLVI